MTHSFPTRRSSDLTTNIGLRAGPRLRFSPDVILFPYAGVNYFDLDATVSGVVRSGPVLPGDDTVNLRYRIDLSSSRPWSVINGFNLALGRRLSLQAEYDWGEGSDRLVLTATYRPLGRGGPFLSNLCAVRPGGARGPPPAGLWT